MIALNVVTIVIVPLLLPTLFGKRDIFTHSPLLWVFEAHSFSLLSYVLHLKNGNTICLQTEHVRARAGLPRESKLVLVSISFILTVCLYLHPNSLTITLQTIRIN